MSEEKAWLLHKILTTSYTIEKGVSRGLERFLRNGKGMTH